MPATDGVALPDDDQQVLAVEMRGPGGVRGGADVDGHPGRDIGGQDPGHPVRASGPQPGDVAAAIEDGVVRGEDHPVPVHLTVAGSHPAGGAPLRDPLNPGSLDEHTAAVDECGSHPRQVEPGVELGLVGEPQRRRDLEGDRRLRGSSASTCWPSPRPSRSSRRRDMVQTALVHAVQVQGDSGSRSNPARLAQRRRWPRRARDGPRSWSRRSMADCHLPVACVIDGPPGASEGHGEPLLLQQQGGGQAATPRRPPRTPWHCDGLVRVAVVQPGDPGVRSHGSPFCAHHPRSGQRWSGWQCPCLPDCRQTWA